MLTGNRVLLIPLIGFLLKAIHDRAGSIQDYCPIPIFPGASCFRRGRLATLIGCDQALALMHVRLLVNVALSRLVREGRKSLKCRSIHVYKQLQVKHHLFSGKCIGSIHSLPLTSRCHVTVVQKLCLPWRPGNVSKGETGTGR